MIDANPDEDLDECHKVFASEVIRALNKFYSIPIDLAPIPDEVVYLTDNIYWGTITISWFFRRKYYDIFNPMRKALKNEDYFHECCMFIPTERNEKFFFNFLIRISKIYEMAVFCFRNGDNYFETARNCIAHFQDKEYFKYAGSWQRLNRISSFLSLWSTLLRPIMIGEIYLCFPECLMTAEEEVENHLEGKGKFEHVEKKETKEDLISEIEKEYNSGLILLLADEKTEFKELGNIEDEIKSMMLYFAAYSPISTCNKDLAKDSNNQNDGEAGCSNRQKPRTRSETSRTRNESPDSFYEKYVGKLTSSLEEKMILKEELKEMFSSFIKKTCFPETSDASEKEKNKTGNCTTLKEDLHLSSSSKGDKDCDKNKSWIGKDIHEISLKSPSEFYLDWAKSAKYMNNTLDDADYIQFLEHDLFVQASTFSFFSFSHGSSSSRNIKPRNIENRLADEGDSGATQSYFLPSSENYEWLTNIKSENESEVQNSNRPLAIAAGSSAAAPFIAKDYSDSSSETNNETYFTETKSAQSSSSKSEENPNKIANANNAKPQQRKPKKGQFKKRGQK